MPQVSMSYQTFDNLEEQIGQHPDEFKSFTKTGANTGIIVTKDVTIDYLYNAMTGFLQFNIGAKHSLAARVAGDNVIAQHIIAKLHDLPPVTPKALEPEFVAEDKSSGIDGDAGDWTAAGDGTKYPAIVTKVPKPATEVPDGGTSSEQVS